MIDVTENRPCKAVILRADNQLLVILHEELDAVIATLQSIRQDIGAERTGEFEN